MQIKSENMSNLFFDIGMDGLKGQYGDEEDCLEGDWDLNDASNAGDGKIRSIHSFNIFWKTNYFFQTQQDKNTEIRHIANLNKLDGISSYLWNIKQTSEIIDGPVINILGLVLLGMAFLCVVGIIYLIRVLV